MIEEMFMELMKNGVLGIVLAVALYDNFQMKKKLFDVIENNTKALTELTVAQQQRRQDFRAVDG